MDWHLTDFKPHQQIQSWIQALNDLYRSEVALFEKQFHADGFEWISYNDAENCVLAFIRKGEKPKNDLVFVCNMTPVVRENYRIGMPYAGDWIEVLNSDDPAFGGSGVNNGSELQTDKIPFHQYQQSLALTLAPLAVSIFKRK